MKTYRPCCSRSREVQESQWRSWRGRRGSRWRQWCSRRSPGTPSWWPSIQLPWRWALVDQQLPCLPCRHTGPGRPPGRRGECRILTLRRSRGSRRLLNMNEKLKYAFLLLLYSKMCHTRVIFVNEIFSTKILFHTYIQYILWKNFQDWCLPDKQNPILIFSPVQAEICYSNYSCTDRLCPPLEGI